MLIKYDVNFLVLVISRLKKNVASTKYTGPLKINIKIKMLVESNNLEMRRSTMQIVAASFCDLFLIFCRHYQLLKAGCCVITSAGTEANNSFAS